MYLILVVAFRSFVKINKHLFNHCQRFGSNLFGPNSGLVLGKHYSSPRVSQHTRNVPWLTGLYGSIAHKSEIRLFIFTNDLNATTSIKQSLKVDNIISILLTLMNSPWHDTARPGTVEHRLAEDSTAMHSIVCFFFVECYVQSRYGTARHYPHIPALPSHSGTTRNYPTQHRTPYLNLI